MLTAIFPDCPGSLQPTLFPCLFPQLIQFGNIAEGKGINPLMDRRYKRAAEGIKTGLPQYAGRTEMTGMGILPGGQIPGAVPGSLQPLLLSCQPVKLCRRFQQRNPGFLINRENIQRTGRGKTMGL